MPFAALLSEPPVLVAQLVSLRAKADYPPFRTRTTGRIGSDQRPVASARRRLEWSIHSCRFAPADEIY